MIHVYLIIVGGTETGRPQILSRHTTDSTDTLRSFQTHELDRREFVWFEDYGEALRVANALRALGELYQRRLEHINVLTPDEIVSLWPVMKNAFPG